MGFYSLLYYVILWKKNRKGSYLNRLLKKQSLGVLGHWVVLLLCCYPSCISVWVLSLVCTPSNTQLDSLMPRGRSTSGLPAHHNIQSSFPSSCAASPLPIPGVSCMLWFSFEEVHSREANLSHWHFLPAALLYHALQGLGPWGAIILS